MAARKAAKATKVDLQPWAGMPVYLVPLDKLIPYARNSKTHPEEQVAKITASLHEFGWVRPILINSRVDLGIRAGHGTVLGAAKLWEAGKEIRSAFDGSKIPNRMVPCVAAEALSPTQIQAYVIADNRLADEGIYDLEMMKLELRELRANDFDLALTGMDFEELQPLLSDAPTEDPDDGAVPDPPSDPVTVAGDVWIFGNHRLVCGDARDAAAWAALMQGDKGDLLATDPPYGVNFGAKNAFLNAQDGGKRIETDIENDAHTPEEMSTFWIAVFTMTRGQLKPGAAFYVTGPQGGDLLLLLLQSLGQSEMPSRHMLIWAKNNHVLGRADYNYKHEPILYGWTKGSHKFYGPAGETSLWEIARPTQSKLHPTMKPVEIYRRAIRNSARAKALVVDPFGGSGPCAIACEELGRCARLIELSPAYCDVIVRRWQDFTKRTAHLEAGGATFADVERKRTNK